MIDEAIRDAIDNIDAVGAAMSDEPISEIFRDMATLGASPIPQQSTSTVIVIEPKTIREAINILHVWSDLGLLARVIISIVEQVGGHVDLDGTLVDG